MMQVQTSAEIRTCTQCRRELPLDRFYRVRPGYWRRVCAACCRANSDRERRQRGAEIKQSRRNARGELRCPRCRHYLPLDCYATRLRNGKRVPVSYCKPCTKVRDEERRQRRERDLARALRDGDRRTELKRKAARERDRERREFVARAIDILIECGFTKAEVGRLSDVSITNLYRWHRREVKVTRAVEVRFGILLRAAADLPRLGPQKGRILHHPALAELMATTRDEIGAHPTRNAWKNGKRS